MTDHSTPPQTAPDGPESVPQPRHGAARPPDAPEAPQAPSGGFFVFVDPDAPPLTLVVNPSGQRTAAGSNGPSPVHPRVQGRCPACRGASLFLGTGGHVTCSRSDCPNPCAADDLLHGSPDVATLTARLRVATTELARLGEGEEKPARENSFPTPGEWIWRWNRATPATRLSVIAQLLDAARHMRQCDQPAPAATEATKAPPYDGPTVAEAAAEDRRWWNSEKDGER
ncbi:DUF6085 family protein [Streptomyces spectabilis]|uniref:Uncharacterized protein n=1 Tax=Streptomyces spectabilis TaxID=68270 RepID=A0A5P2X863_STRST|nr:DUF6085 family protein [Streptomyces spectabilis]MBB5108353.1 hypothetical protein [Streptomyces spectabilis]MCI3901110.1 DUF6085 family protein [Streptomyces spectabilis]QEV58602.1 hypothetical protein CP982_07625 [Streptomyces spectabilis]GGV46017.1 hypothetical protein GCM10010245_72150 [Streptomyces spectabilis]